MTTWQAVRAELLEWASAAGCVLLPVLWVTVWATGGAGVALLLDADPAVGGSLGAACSGLAIMAGACALEFIEGVRGRMDR